MRFTKENPLRVGTDCSGIEAPIMALRKLKVPFSHEFSSEIDKHSVASIKANYKPKILFGDMMKRPLKDVPDIDLYVCGFPCQPFSVAGKHLGDTDPRGVVFWECLRVLQKKKPMMFVLENVKGLMMVRDGDFFREILQGLSGLPGYFLSYKILNTKHYGIPQSRERLYIVGIRKKFMKRAFEWPREVPLQQPLTSFMDGRNRRQESVWPSIEKKEVLAKIPVDSVFVDLSFPQGSLPNLATLCPCLNTSANLWNVPYHRLATTSEYLTLQGFPADFKQVVSDRQLKKQVGNSMSVSVLRHLLKAILKCLD